jgi:CheY-like chemotaxis protein
MIVVDVLEEIGCTVLEAGDGDSGLSILTSGTRVDLLVSDIGLPGSMNGRQLAEAARQQRSDLKVLFITGYSEGFVVGDDLLGKGMQVLTKPFSIVTLTTRIKEMIDA